MGEQFDASRPIYAQLVERLKARILAGTYPPGGHLFLSVWATGMITVTSVQDSPAIRLSRWWLRHTIT